MAPPSVPIDTLRQFDRLTFIARRPARAGTGGDHRARRLAPSTDFVDYRPYQPGDDFRRVDWNVFGRLGSLQMKLTEGRERLDVVVVLDCSSSMAFGEPDKLAFAAQLASALGYVGMGRADSVRIVCLGSTGSYGPFARRSRTAEMVKLLSNVAPTGKVDLNTELSECVPERRLNSVPLVIIVSDLLTPDGAARALESLQLKQLDVVVLQVVSQQELQPRLNGEMELIDAESGESLEMGISVETLDAYRTRLQEWLDQRATDCRGKGMRYAQIRTDRPLANVMLDDLRRAGVLR